ncbi:MAG TPA: sugar phosphate isomerase/epimerase [Candidatus Bathyarchaeota archaeon]|nr:sugar phosphate isomerase/epimerase [Candidatus Bathyarchaeota archaeon]
MIGVQLYTFRDYMRTKRGLEHTLKRIAEIGYSNVELAGFGPVNPEEFSQILSRFELSVCSSHVPFDMLYEALEDVLEMHETVGCRNLVCPSIPRSYVNEDGFKEVAGILSDIAGVINREGFTLSYHNHADEFTKWNGKTGLEILSEYAPKLLFQLDTYWVQYGGASTIEWINRLRGRMISIHLKDMKVSLTSKGILHVNTYVGDGNLNWVSILQSSIESGIRYLIVEQEFYEISPFESTKRSLNHLKKILSELSPS